MQHAKETKPVVNIPKSLNKGTQIYTHTHAMPHTHVTYPSSNKNESASWPPKEDCFCIKIAFPFTSMIGDWRVGKQTIGDSSG